MSVNFVVEGKPVAKERPRFFRGHAYTPAKTTDYEKLIATTFKKLKLEKLDGYIKADIKIYNKVPKSYSKKKAKDCLDGVIRPTTNDVDNIVKCVLDGLNKIAYDDDSQIQEIHAFRYYADKDYISVELDKL